QIEQQRGELLGRSAHEAAPLQRKLVRLAIRAGKIAAPDQHQPRRDQRRLLAVVHARAGEPQAVVFLADARRTARAIHFAVVRAEIAAAVMLARLRSPLAQLCRGQLHTGFTCPRGTTSSAPPDTQMSWPMQCADASLASQSTALTTSSTSATRRFGKVGISAGPIRCSASSAIGVRTQPGETRFTRTLGASSTAIDIIIDCSAPFEA